MVTAQPQASTLDEFQLPDLILIQPQGYCYFQAKDYPRTTTQSMGLFSAETLRNYLFHFTNDADTARVFFTSGLGEQEVSFSPNEPIQLIRERIFQEFHTTQYRTRTHLYHEILDTLSSNVAPASFDYLKAEQAVINLFDAYRHQEFDADIAYQFTNDLDMLIQASGKSAIRAIDSLIKKQSVDQDIVSETLKALGRIEHENTKEQRYQVLMDFIKDDSVIIRDAAVSGLSFLDDKRALPQLRMLLETETLPIAKNNIKVTIKGLELY